MGLLRALVVEMARLNPELIEESGRAEKNRRADTLQITRALEYVGDHYDREIKIGDLAHLCHLSETQMCIRDRSGVDRGADRHPVFAASGCFRGSDPVSYTHLISNSFGCPNSA